MRLIVELQFEESVFLPGLEPGRVSLSEDGADMSQVESPDPRGPPPEASFPLELTVAILTHVFLPEHVNNSTIQPNSPSTCCTAH